MNRIIRFVHGSTIIRFHEADSYYRHMCLPRKKRNVGMGIHGAIALDQEIKWIPLVQRKFHREVHANQPATLEASKKLLFIFVPSEGATNKNHVSESLRVH